MGVGHGSLFGIGFSGKGLKLNGGMIQQPKFDNPRGSGYNNVIDTLWWTYKKQLKMAIEIVDFPIKNGDFPLLC